MNRDRTLHRFLKLLALTGVALLGVGLSAADRQRGRDAATPTPKPVLSTGGPSAVEETNVNLDLRPDLVVDLKATATYIYPVYVTVKNAGLTKSAPAVLKLACDEYKGSMKLGKCLSKIEESIPALDPGKQVMPTLPFAPGLHCVDPDKTGITACRVTASLLLRRGASEKTTANNKKTLEVAVWK